MRTIPIYLFSLILLSCSETIHETVLKVKIRPFNVEKMYDTEEVENYLFDTKEMDVDSLRDLAREEFLRGIDLFANKKQPDNAITLFKSSIRIFPDAKYYYELGKALISQGVLTVADTKESIDALKVAEHLNFQPKYQVNYNLACAYNLLARIETHEGNETYHSWEVASNLRDAFLGGYSDTAAMLKDNRLSEFTTGKEFRIMLADVNARKQKDGGANSLFDAFKGAFPQLNGELVIESEMVEMGQYSESISYDFAPFIPEMENTEFGREVSHDYFYVGKLAETPEYVALVYSSVSFWGAEMQPVHTILATYDTKGKLLSRKMIACQCSASKIKIASVKDGQIKVEEINRVWAEPIDKVGFDQNRVEKYDVTATATFAINASGQIENKNVPKEFNDSTLIVKE